MPANIRVIHAHDFIKATPEGRLDLMATERMLVEIALAAAPLVEYDVLLDTRKAHSEMTDADLWNLAAGLSTTFRKTYSRPLKTAVLCPLERFNHSRFFALCAQNRGFEVAAFTSIVDAYEWLIADKT